MKRISTLTRFFKESFLLFLLLISITLINTKSYGQAKTYATVAPTSGIFTYAQLLGGGLGGPTVGTAPADGEIDHPEYAATADNTAATLTSKYFSLLVLGAESETWLQLKYPTPVAAGQTTFIRFDAPTSTGLNLDALKIVGDLTNLFKNNLVEFQVYSNAAAAVGNTQNNGNLIPDANISVQTVKDAAGLNYFAVTSTVPYNSVRVRLRFRTGLLGLNLGATVSMKIYNAFTVAPENCAPSIFANIGEVVGVNVSLTELVKTPNLAIDKNLATSSQLQAGLVGVGSTISQTVFLNGKSGTDDYAKVTLSVPASLLTLDLFNNVTLQAYDGNTPVGPSSSISTLLNLDLLGLFANTRAVPVFFRPGVPFDRIKISMGKVVAVGGNILSGGLNIHEVERTVAKPLFAGINGGITGVCGTQVNLSATAPNAAFTYNLYRKTGTDTKTLISGANASGVFSEAGLTPGVYTYYLSAQKAGCTAESDLDSVKVTVTANAVAATATAAPICAGSNGIFVINNAVAGQTYNWYNEQTGGVSVFTGTTYDVGPLSANRTYYIETLNGNCSVATRTAVRITVNSLPADAQVSTNNITISSGQTATLTAVAPTAGSTIEWYELPNGGIAVAAGTSFTTPALTSNKIYYVGTRSASGCASTNRIAVTINVLGVTTGVTCKSANAQQNGIKGLLCLLCGVTDPGNAVDANPTNFSRLNLTISVGASVYQRLIFPNAGVASDSIRLDLGVPVGLADLSVLGGITVNVMNGEQVVNSYPLNSQLLNLQLLSGSRFKATLPAGAAYDRVEISLGAIVGALSSVDVYGAEVIYPNPTISNTGLAICSGGSTTLTANPVAGTTLKWYADAIGGTELATGNTYSPTGLTATTTYYIEVSKGTCVNTERMPVKVTVNPAIVFAPTVLTNATIGSNYTRQITPATGGSPAFTYALASGSTLPAGLSLSSTGELTGKPTTAGNASFSIIVTDSKGCNATATFNLVVTDALAIGTAILPNGTTNVLYPNQTLPAATGGTGPYNYIATNLPPGLILDPDTHVISGTPTQAGTYPVKVTVTDANGNKATQDYSIIVRDPLVLAPATLAEGTVGTLYPAQTIPTVTGGVGPYAYTATGLPNGLIFNETTHEITGTPTASGTYTVSVTVKDADGKTVTTPYTLVVKDPLVLPVATLPDGNVNVVYTSQALPSATGGTGPYTYSAPTLPAGLQFDPVTRIISGTPGQSGLFTIPVTVKDQTGKTVTTNYTLRVIGALSLPTAALANGTVGTVYPGETLPEVSGGTGPYTYLEADMPPGLTFDRLTRKVSGTPTLGGTFTFSITAKDAANNATTTNFSILVKVAAPAVASTTICAGTTATLTVAPTITGVTYNWYAGTGNTAIFTGPSYTTAALTTNTTYYVAAVSGTETSDRTAVTVTVRPAPALAVVSSGQSISAGQTATLQADAGTGNTLAWYSAATGGNALSTSTTYTTPILNTTTTYYVETQNAAGCVSLTRVPVTVTVTSGPVNPNCNAATSQETKIESLLCLLCGITNPSGSTDADPATFTTINLGVNVAGVAYQKLKFSKQGAATDSIRIDMEIPVGLADIGLINGGTITVYKGNTPVKVYPLNSSLLNLQLLSGNRFQATFPATGDFDAVEIRVGAVVGLLSNYNIYGATIIYPNPTVATTGQTVCAGNTTTLSATANGGTTLNWYAAATGGPSLHEGETFTTPALAATTTYYIEVSKAGCPNATRIPVTVTVTPVPTAPAFATVLPVCYGSTTSISVNSPVTGVNYNWYTVANGGTSIFTGPTFVTPALTANTTYYVEAANPGCGVSTRTAVPVTVNPMIALPQVQASSTTVDPGQTVILTASPIDPDVSFNWYATATDTTPIYTGAVYVTPPLTVTTTYYVEAKSNVTGCTSVSRVQVTINVNNGGNPNPVPCERALTETHSVNGVALLSAVFNPQLAVDDDTKTGSSLVMPVGLLGASVSQNLIFGSPSTLGDTVQVLLSAPGKLLSVGLLSSIQVGTYNGGTNNNDAVSINNNLIKLELLSNNSQALISFVPTVTFDQVQVRLNAGLAGVLSTVDVNYARRILVAPTLQVPNPTACANQQVALSILNANPALTYKWYDATGATVLSTGPTYNPTVGTQNVTFYVTATSASGCASARTKVDVMVTPVPDAPQLVSANVNTCSGSDVTLEVKNPLTGITYKWYDSNNVYQSNKDGVKFDIPNVTANVDYYVEATTTICGVPSATKTKAEIKIGTLDKPVITPMAVTIKSGTSAVLTATSSTAGAMFKWYDDVALTTVKSTDSRYITDPLINNTNAPVIHTFYVTAETSGGCPASAAATVDVTVLPAVNGTDVPCEPATVSKRAGVDGVALLTAVFNPQFAVDNNTETASSLVMPVGALGASVYQLVGFNGPSTIGDTIRVRLSSPGKLLSVGVFPSIELTTYNGLVSNNDMITASNPLIKLDVLSQDGDYIFSFVPQKQFDGVELRLRSGLASVLSTLDFNYAQRVLVAPIVSSANASACVGSGATLSVLNPVAGLTYQWYKGTDASPIASGTTYTTDATLAAGTYKYYVTASRNNCVSAKTGVDVTIFAAPDAPVPAPGNPTAVCPNTAVTLAVTPVNGVSYNWYDALTLGNKLATNTNTYTTAANLAPGVYNFYVEAANGNSCVSTAARTLISITVKRFSTPGDVTVTGAETAVCKDSKAKLTASSALSNPKFEWFTDAALTQSVSTNAIYEPTVSVTTTFYVTVSGDEACVGGPASAKAVTVTVNTPATAADLNITADANAYCAGSKATLTATTTTVNTPTFVWYSDANLTQEVFRGAVYQPVVTVTTNFYVTVSGTNKCPNLPADAKVVSIIVNNPATPSDIAVTGNGTPFCAGSKATLTATAALVGHPLFIWYSDANLTQEVFRGAVYEPIVTATTNYYVTVSGDNRCPNDPGNAKVVAITVNTPATAADLSVTGNNAAYCKGTKATLTATTTTVNNPVFTWYTDADLTNAIFTGPVFEPVLTATTTYYVTVRGSNRCESTKSSAKAVTLVVNPPALSSDITVKGNDAPFCNGTQAILTAESTTVTNPVFTWYTNAALTDVASNDPVFKPTLTTTTTYYLTVRGSNKCENSIGDAKIVTLIVNTPATAADVIVSGAETPVCAGNTVKLTANSTTVTSPVFTWYTDAALTNAIFTGAVLEKTLTVTTTYYVTVKGANKCENLPGTGKAVTVTVSAIPDVPIVNNGGAVTICSGDGTTLSIQNIQSGVTYQWYSAAQNGTLLGAGPTLAVGPLTTTTDYYVQATSASGCGNATGRVKATVTVSTRPDVPTVASNSVNTCLGSTATLSISNPVAGVTYNWYATAASTTILGSGNSFTTPAITAATTNFYVEAKSATCTSTTRAMVTVNAGTIPLPPASVTGASTPQCAGTGTVLTINNPDAALKYSWFASATGGTALNVGNTFTVPALNATTIYYVESSNATTGCISASRTAVTVTVLPKLAAPVVSVQERTATSVIFAWAPVPGATAYEVSLDGGLSWIAPSSGPQGTTYLIAGLKPDQNVNISVRAVGQLACQLSDASSLNGKSDNPLGNTIFIPNTFTPNNDGKNDVFYVYGNTIAKMRLRVYNQWGQFIYESLNIQSGWDGTFKGQIQPNGVYVYYVEAEFNDGTKTTKKGTITLLR
ncbi:putative Ig domain-containing protein [Pedobacter sp. MC2016-24]|uniref:Ig-like domain-containing protein n=1 Tax=Pedobacter sp. MC2016-24 TaxID=2780090 RepID=UPI001882632A|nr:putative Ig domain-containing protein [Pedobacter sp. MC2016-24]MBE9599687.1 putative Ig domain-containing protein [Pedobacter sp. MC2016-24]